MLPVELNRRTGRRCVGIRARVDFRRTQLTALGRRRASFFPARVPLPRSGGACARPTRSVAVVPGATRAHGGQATSVASLTGAAPGVTFKVGDGVVGGAGRPAEGVGGPEIILNPCAPLLHQ